MGRDKRRICLKTKNWNDLVGSGIASNQNQVRDLHTSRSCDQVVLGGTRIRTKRLVYPYFKTYLPFVNHVRKIHNFFSKYEESQSYTIGCFIQVFKKLFDAQTSQFCRRYKRAIHDQFEAYSLLKLDEQSLQMREETELFAALAHEITEKIESSKKELHQDAINTISSIISFYSKVQGYQRALIGCGGWVKEYL